AGGRRVDLIEVGPAHTAGDLIVHVPDADTVFAADVMFVGVAPVMWAGPTENWIRALDRISQLAPKVVVPGHGPISSLDDVALLRDYLSWVQAEAETRLVAGESVYDTSRALVFSDEYRSSPWSDWEGPERIVVTVATIDRRRRETSGPVSEVQRAQIFGGVAHLAGELQRAGR
ncbi:MAG: MBL fold metallo-hydrolase, partial [Solirubrobacteraceae bacterium]